MTAAAAGGRGLRLVLGFAAVALAYYLAGRLGLLLAIPPGYATAVWPPSGIALAAVLLAGPRAGLGVFAGSFMVNIGTGLNPEAWLASAVVPLAIAAGAGLQALLGASLIRRLVGYSHRLIQEQQVIRILFLGGPAACLLNASIGVGSLWLAGKLPADALPFNWFTWWVGDSIGVLIFTPLVLVWAARSPRQGLRLKLFVTLPLAALFSVVVLMFIFISQREQARIETEFKTLTQDIGEHLRVKLDKTLDVLSALEGFYASSARITPEAFEIFAARLLVHLPSAYGLSWNPVLKGRAVLPSGAPVLELDRAGRRIPAGRRDWYVPVQYVVPLAGNEGVIGFDVLSEPVRRAAVEQALDTGRAAATGRVTLIQDKITSGILVFMPVCRHGLQPDTLETRREHLEGFAVAIFVLSGLMQETAEQARGKGLGLQLYDQPETESSPLYELPAGEPTDPAGSLHDSQSLEFAGKRWRLEFQLPADAAGARSWESWFVLAGGLLLTGLLGILLLLSVGRTARVETQVAERTAELRQSQAELQRQAVQLERSNRELEQFAYAASHDLKAPLRTVGSFAGLLDQRYRETLQGEGREFLDFISGGVRQMQALVDDLLELSRVDARAFTRGPLDLRAVLDRALAALKADLDGSRALLHIAELPALAGDPAMLARLWQNLISNALKFQPVGQRPEIWVSAQPEENGWRFGVRDNGIGMAPQHLEEIFRVFRRLHSSEEYAGTGIGLAICRKIVQLHGGRIWAESAPGQGASFYFTLPSSAAAN